MDTPASLHTCGMGRYEWRNSAEIMRFDQKWRNAIRIISGLACLQVKTNVKIIKLANGGLKGDDEDCVDFVESLFPEESQKIEWDANEYEVRKASDARQGRKTRQGRIYKHYLVRWKDHKYLTWIDKADLKCGASVASNF